MRVVVADPPAFTPPYDHALAAALARAGAEVELVTSRFRFGDVARCRTGYRRREIFYPLSSRLFQPVTPAPAAEGARAPARACSARRASLPTSSTCSGSPRRSSTRGCCATARRSSSRRTTCCRGGRRPARPGSGGALFGRFERIVVHSERGRQTLAAFGVAGRKLRVIPHPVFPERSGPSADDGATVLALGMVRPYKQVEHSAEAARADGARLLVAGDRSGRYSPRRRGARLGYSRRRIEPCARRVDRRRLPLPRGARPERARSCRRSAPACRAVVYDVGGLAEPVRTSARAASSRPTTSTALGNAIRELLDDRVGARRRSRRSAARPRGADLGRLARRAPRPLPRARVIFRRDRFGDLVRAPARPVRRGRCTSSCSEAGDGSAVPTTRPSARTPRRRMATYQLVLEIDRRSGWKSCATRTRRTLDDDSRRPTSRRSAAPRESAFRS
mgnify:CR=1 FL=1